MARVSRTRRRPEKTKKIDLRKKPPAASLTKNRPLKRKVSKEAAEWPGQPGEGFRVLCRLISASTQDSRKNSLKHSSSQLSNQGAAVHVVAEGQSRKTPKKKWRWTSKQSNLSRRR